MIKKIFISTLFVCIATAVIAQEKTQNAVKSDSVKKLSRYEKLFDKKKNVKTTVGVITLHNVDGKVYFELPVNVIGRSFLMSSVVDNVSDMSLGYVGQRTSRPTQICFTKTDSLVQIRLVPAPKIVDSDDKGIQDAVNRSSLPSILSSSPILAFNNDSTAVVFDATPFFVSGSKYIGSLNASSFGGFIQKVSSFSKDLSALKDIESYDDNIAIISNMTYTFKTYFLGMESGGQEYLTVDLRTTLSLLPEVSFKYRLADYRIGTGVTEFEKFNSKEQGSQISYMANRWRIESGKPIVFYVDTLFIPAWREAIKKGLTKWNEAFEKIGFKDVIKVYDYPTK
ncbi:MAG: DUF5117 domain-containing protein, partial [Thiovulaceae bacterium]|nr:DUF5117 domain-containing protein [Sulfurimonadaceae bacterium]